MPNATNTPLPLELCLAVDQVCDAFEQAWMSGARPALEDRLGSVAEASRPLLLEELIRIELEWRWRRGERPAAAEYRTRFPACAGAIDGWLAEAQTGAEQLLETPPDSAHPGLLSTGTFEAKPASAAPTPTSRILGDFELLELLGAGGMGEVYRARQRGLNRLVAVKVIRRDRAASPQARARFRREAEAVARLSHPHIVAVHAWGEHDDTPYFALEYCTGGSLRERLKGEPKPPAEAARLVEKLARAVQAGHDQGIIHRDLKPANVLLAPPADEAALNTAWGVPKITDFGLCRLFREDEARTAEGVAAGSPRYMAPEQAEGRSKDIGPATDVWALGAILYEVLTGQSPFTGDNVPSVLYAVCHNEPPRPRQLRPEVPAGLEAICLKCLEKDPARRYPSALALAEDLQQFRLGANAPAASGDKHPPAESQKKTGRRRFVASVHARIGALGCGVTVTLAVLLISLPLMFLLHSVGPSSRPARNGQYAAVPSSSLSREAHRHLDNTSATAPTTAAPKLRVLSLQVRRYANQPDGERLRGELGKDTFRVRLNDRVDVEAALSEPAYAYLIAFNPTDKPNDREQLVPESETDRPPEQRDRLTPDCRLRLNDGVGLQAFAVVASRQQLPAYAKWRQQRSPLPWPQTPATSGVVWQTDGDRVHGLFEPGFNRATEEAAGDKVMVRYLVRTLKAMPGVEAVSVVGFAVDRAD
jgi:serine/threonine protein kinase